MGAFGDGLKPITTKRQLLTAIRSAHNVYVLDGDEWGYMSRAAAHAFFRITMDDAASGELLARWVGPDLYILRGTGHEILPTR